MISTKKQAELLQSSDISKISLRNGEKSGAAHAAPPIPYGYSIARICSIRDCFFCLRIVHTDKISSIPNNTRMNSPISKTGNLIRHYISGKSTYTHFSASKDGSRKPNDQRCQCCKERIAQPLTDVHFT